MYRVIIFSFLALVVMDAYPTTATVPATQFPRCLSFIDELREAHTENLLFLWSNNWSCQSCGNIMYLLEILYARPFVREDLKREDLKREFGVQAGSICFTRFG